jgi:hypothetical protein
MSDHDSEHDILNKLSVNDGADLILEAFKEKFGGAEMCHHKVDYIRNAAGLFLSSIHTTLIAAGQTNDDKLMAVQTALDTIERMAGCLQRDIEVFKVEGVMVSAGNIPFNPEQVQ